MTRLNMHKYPKKNDNYELELETEGEDYYIYENELYMFITEDDVKIDYKFFDTLGYDSNKLNKITLNISPFYFENSRKMEIIGFHTGLNFYAWCYLVETTKENKNRILYKNFSYILRELSHKIKPIDIEKDLYTNTTKYTFNFYFRVDEI